MPSDQSATLEAGIQPKPFGKAAPLAAATRQRIRLGVLLGADIGAAVLATVLVAWTLLLIAGRIPAGSQEIETRDLLHLRGHVLVVIFAVQLAYLAHCGHYTRRLPFWIAMRELLIGCAAAFVAECLLTQDAARAAEKLEDVLFWIVFLSTLLCLRTIARTLLMRGGLWSLETLVLGEPATAKRVIAALNSQPSLGYHVVDRVEPGALRGASVSQALRNLVAGCGAEFLIIAGRTSDSTHEGRIIAALDRLQIPFGLVSDVETLPVRRSQEHYFFGHDVTFLTFNNNPARPVAQLVKRALDLGVACALLVAVAPVMLLIALLIRRDGGPVLFRQRRIGRNGVYYPCLKFRTMRVDADQILQELLASDPLAAADWTMRQKLARDPRITAFGRVLRNTSLDELPQLFNIIRGQMSLVGPRPIVPSEVSRYGDQIAYYYEARPGLTGLWQVSGRSETSYDRRVQLDVWYVRNWSVWHDVVILLKTIPALLMRRGAI